MERTEQNDREFDERQRSPAGFLPAGLVIRACRPDDAEALAALANMPKYRYGTLRLPYETAEEWRERIERKGPGDLNLVAVLDGMIVGSAGLHRLPGRRSHTAEIGMGVHDNFHGRGIGTALVAALIEAADRWLAIRRLQLTVYADNELAIRLYRKFGFEVEGTFRAFAFRDGTYADAIAMARVSLDT